MTDPILVWGPPTWNFLHAIALTYPQKADIVKRDAMILMLKSLEGVIPCKECRDHYADWFAREESRKVAFNGRESLFDALVDLHNSVNKMNNKPTIDHEKAHVIHGQFAAAGSVCPSSNKNSTDAPMIDRRFFVVAIVVCVVIGIIAHRRRLAKASTSETRVA